MYDEDERPEQQGNWFSGKLSTVFVLLVAAFLGILVINEYCPPIDKAFSPQAFYVGKYQKAIENPRDIYNKMVISKTSTVGASKCTLTTTYLNLDDDSVWHPLGSDGNIAWPVIGVNNGSFDNKDAGVGYNIDSGGNAIESNAEVKGYTHWYIWANVSDMRILSPWAQVKFVNSNVDDSSYTIAVMPVGGDGEDETRWLEIRNVENWFCHMSSGSHVSSHSTRIGLNADAGAPDVLGEMGEGFAILGKADKKSYIVGMYKSDGGTSQECSPYYVFHPEEEIGY